MKDLFTTTIRVKPWEVQKVPVEEVRRSIEERAARQMGMHALRRATTTHEIDPGTGEHLYKHEVVILSVQKMSSLRDRIRNLEHQVWNLEHQVRALEASRTSPQEEGEADGTKRLRDHL